MELRLSFHETGRLLSLLSFPEDHGGHGIVLKLENGGRILVFSLQCDKGQLHLSTVLYVQYCTDTAQFVYSICRHELARARITSVS